jgi:hypothetical protein
MNETSTNEFSVKGGNFSIVGNSTVGIVIGREVGLHFSIVFGTLIGTVTTIGVMANALVVLAVIGDRKMRRSPMNLLLLNLVRLNGDFMQIPSFPLGNCRSPLFDGIHPFLAINDSVR